MTKTTRKSIMKAIQTDSIDKMRKDLYDCQSKLHNRAGKLLRKKKPFIVVACDEPYFLEVYRMIRREEKRKGTWTTDCEAEYVSCVTRWQFDIAWQNWNL